MKLNARSKPEKTQAMGVVKRLFSPFVMVFSGIAFCLYSYAAIRLSDHGWVQGLIAIPFFLVWVVPVVYWHGQRESRKMGFIDHVIHIGCFLSMGWINFLMILLILRDLALVILGALSQAALKGQGFPLFPELAPWYQILDHRGTDLVVVLSILMWILGTFKATQGPVLTEVEIEVPNLHPDLQNFRIVQISDLHVGPTIRRSYVERVVAQCNSLQADLIAMTGDMVDGSVEDLGVHAEPLKHLESKLGTFMCLGNHDYYSGAREWTRFWTEELGIVVLRNEHVICPIRGQGLLMVAGVTDPASWLEGPGQEPNPQQAAETSYPETSLGAERQGMLRLMLAHNPKLAAGVAAAGFDVQLSGHTHAGQFLPWTWATKIIHTPHYAGLSREGTRLQVYVNSGTGSWGPPLRFGTSTELTLIKFVRA